MQQLTAKFYAILLVSLFCTWISSCSTKGLFSAKTAHEKYADGIDQAGLRNTHLGAMWFSASDKSLQRPVAITIPYKETGYFAADKPDAAGYSFSLKRGEQLSVKVQTTPLSSIVFAELWQPRPGKEPKFLTAIDTIKNELQYEIDEDGNYLVRLQPELLKGVEYTLTITTAPSLAFPVRSNDNPRMISFWGADRDGGSRSHEGIDIGAKKRTPAIAIANGRVTRVDENNLGGKVVFIRPEGKNYNLYYAHLDTQIARQGDIVREGEVIGLIGNTGNARFTGPHLHFGIYAPGGAVDPFPFINNNRPQARAVTASVEQINKFLRSENAVTAYTMPSVKSTAAGKTEKGTVMKVLAATENWYKVLLPGNIEGYVNSQSLTTKVLRQQKLKDATRLLDQPDQNAAAKLLIPSGNDVAVMGTQPGFLYVNFKDQQGWIAQ